jgi:cystathionine beta-lyase/cystathionine gamma-synthase
VVDLEGVVAFCREHGLLSVVDNTCATPVNFRPIARGFGVTRVRAEPWRRRDAHDPTRDDLALRALTRGAAVAEDYRGGLIRLSIGLEAPEDLIEDFAQALGSVS